MMTRIPMSDEIPDPDFDVVDPDPDGLDDDVEGYEYDDPDMDIEDDELDEDFLGEQELYDDDDSDQP